jgi:hypothetical protein
MNRRQTGPLLTSCPSKPTRPRPQPAYATHEKPTTIINSREFLRRSCAASSFFQNFAGCLLSIRSIVVYFLPRYRVLTSLIDFQAPKTPACGRLIALAETFLLDWIFAI